jgi:hypothetical protein
MLTKTSDDKSKILDRHKTSAISPDFLPFTLAHPSKDGSFVKKMALLDIG